MEFDSSASVCAEYDAASRLRRSEGLPPNGAVLLQPARSRAKHFLRDTTLHGTEPIFCKWAGPCFVSRNRHCFWHTVRWLHEVQRSAGCFSANRRPRTAVSGVLYLCQL